MQKPMMHHCSSEMARWGGKESLLNAVLYFFYVFIFIFEREQEHAHVQGEGGGAEGEDLKQTLR